MLRLAVLSFVGALIALTAATAVFAQTGEYEPDQLFVSVGGGLIRVFDPGGEELGELDTETQSSEIGDMCFGPNVLYTMNFSDGSISKFNSEGELVESQWAVVPGAVESCVLDADGNLYVGEDGDTGGVLVKLNPDGEVVQTFVPDVDASGVDQIDLAEDQCTMLYTSEGNDINAFDVCADEQLPDFASDIGSSCFSLRIRPNGEVLVACDLSVYRVSAAGEVIQTYEPAGVTSADGGLFALNLDPDNAHFFTATYQEGRIWRIDIESGEGTEEPYLTTAIAGESIGGVAVFGEITVAAPLDDGRIIDPDRPEIVQKVPDPTQISTEPDVVGTNVLFSVIAVIVILLCATLFNEVIEDNNEEIEGFARRYLKPFSSVWNGLGGIWSGLVPPTAKYSAIAAVAVVLAATALVYGFLEPGFKLNKDGFLLVISVVIALGAVTYAYSGMEARVTERRFGTPSGVRVFPVAFLIAIVSVLLSRIIKFEPGLVYGFVASNVILGAADLAPKQKGQAVFISAVALLSTFGLAWALMIPTREWAESDANPLAVVLEAGSTLVVVGAIESLAFTLVPIEFTHGMKIMRWSKFAWGLMAFVAAFLFWHVLIVQDNAGFKAVEHSASLGAFAALGVCIALTGGAWGFFYWRKQQAAKAGGAGESKAVTSEPAAPEAPAQMEESPMEVSTDEAPPDSHAPDTDTPS